MFRRLSAIPHVVALALNRPAAAMVTKFVYLCPGRRPPRIDDYNWLSFYRLGGDRYVVHRLFVGRIKLRFLGFGYERFLRHLAALPRSVFEPQRPVSRDLAGDRGTCDAQASADLASA